MSLQDVSDALGMSVSHLSRVENGIRKLQPDDVSALLGFYRVPVSKRADLLALVREGDKYNWLLEHDGSFTMLENFMRFEREAVVLKNFEASLIPGLLQISEYTRAYCRGVNPNLAKGDLDTVVNYRMRRQQDCRRSGGPLLHVIVDEAVCRRRIGGPQVMCSQLRYLVQAANSSNLSLQVIPASVASHPGLEGSFMLLDSGDLGELLYTEDRCSVAFLEEEHHVSPAKDAFRRLCELACSPEDSLDLITSIADELAHDCGSGETSHGTSQLAQEQSKQLEVELRRSGVR